MNLIIGFLHWIFIPRYFSIIIKPFSFISIFSFHHQFKRYNIQFHWYAIVHRNTVLHIHWQYHQNEYACIIVPELIWRWNLWEWMWRSLFVMWAWHERVHYIISHTILMSTHTREPIFLIYNQSFPDAYKWIFYPP